MRLYGSDKMKMVYDAIGLPEGEAISDATLSKAIEKAQKKVEENNFSIRRNLLKLDDVINEQRNLVFQERNRLLALDDTAVLGKLVDIVHAETEHVIKKEQRLQESVEKLKDYNILLHGEIIDNAQWKNNLIYAVDQAARERFDKTGRSTGLCRYVREIMLTELDEQWIRQMEDIDLLKEGIYNHSYAQRDPVVEYRLECYQLFEKMLNRTRKNICKNFFASKFLA